MRHRRRRRRRLVLVLLVLAAASGGAVLLVEGRSGPSSGIQTSHSAAKRGAVRALARSGHVRFPPVRLTERALASLAVRVRDAGAVALGADRALLLGGLTAADTSTDSVVSAGPRGGRSLGRLPIAVHDTAAVRLGASVYVFGGGTSANTQSDAIFRLPAAGGAGSVAGRLPAPSSDQSATAIAGTAYVVGGFTGSRWLDTIVAWRPGRPARIVARLPTPVRYAAVTAVNGMVVIAGGSLPSGTASATVFGYRPPGRRIQRLGRLPAATTHAAAAVIDGAVFVIGGRGATLGSQTGRIVRIDVTRHRIAVAGVLASPRSDLAAVSVGHRILLVGGLGANGTLSSVSELVAATVTRRPAAVDVYADDGAGGITGAARLARRLVYVPDSRSATVDVIDQRSFKVIAHFPVGELPQHVVPSYDLRTLYVTNDLGNSLTVINPRTGRPGRTIPVADPYNMYFTPDGQFAVVVAERLHRLDFRDAHTFALERSLPVPCAGVDHLDFSADGRYLIASCEFSGRLVKVDVAGQSVVGVLDLPGGPGDMPQDVRLSPDGSLFYVADLAAGGVWKIDGDSLTVAGFVATGKGPHGLYPSRDGKRLYVSNRGEGSISVLSFGTQSVIAKWRIPGGGSPDMGGVSADGKVLWLSGRYNGVVYAISTTTGRLLARIAVGAGPHGLCVWPQPGRYSLGHTGNMR